MTGTSDALESTFPVVKGQTGDAVCAGAIWHSSPWPLSPTTALGHVCSLGLQPAGWREASWADPVPRVWLASSPLVISSTSFNLGALAFLSCEMGECGPSWTGEIDKRWRGEQEGCSQD